MTILARLAAAATLALIATPALAAPSPAMTAPQEAAAPQSVGLTVEAVRAWLEGLGADSATVERSEDQVFLRIQDGPLAWGIFFYGCQADTCSDLQFTSVFTAGPEVTLERVNAWNRDRRYLKAFHMPAEDGQEPAAVVQYDLIIDPAKGVEQLTEPTSIWVEMVREFATYVGFDSPAATPPSPPAQ